jgi:hypothetical protein
MWTAQTASRHVSGYIKINSEPAGSESGPEKGFGIPYNNNSFQKLATQSILYPIRIVVFCSRFYVHTTHCQCFIACSIATRELGEWCRGPVWPFRNSTRRLLLPKHTTFYRMNINDCPRSSRSLTLRGKQRVYFDTGSYAHHALEGLEPTNLLGFQLHSLATWRLNLLLAFFPSKGVCEL